MGGVGSGRKPKRGRAMAALEKPEKPALAPQDKYTLTLASVLGKKLQQAVGDADVVTVAREALEPRATPPQKAHLWRNALILALSAIGMNQREIGEHVGMSQRSVRTALYALRKRGLGVDTEDRLAHAIVPAAMDALEADILDPNSKAHHKAYALALEGAGVLRRHTADTKAPVMGAPLALEVVWRFEEGGPKPITGQVVGRPRED